VNFLVIVERLVASAEREPTTGPGYRAEDRFIMITRWKVLCESTNLSESVFVANTWQHLPHLLFCGPLVPNFSMELFCKQSPVYGVF